jgi:LacI family gluconate utilization system Gnt-I transcriptional repressor
VLIGHDEQKTGHVSSGVREISWHKTRVHAHQRNTVPHTNWNIGLTIAHHLRWLRHPAVLPEATAFHLHNAIAFSWFSSNVSAYISPCNFFLLRIFSMLTTRLRPRLADIARAAGVSTMTVARVLREPAKVSAKTLATVRKALDATGYVPDLVARSLASQRTGVVAMVVPSLASSLIAEVTQGLSQTLARHGRQVMIGASNYSADEEEALVRNFLSRRVDAIYLTGTSQTKACLDLLARAGIPVVQGGNYADTPLDMAVGTSNFESSRDLVMHLVRRYGGSIANICGTIAGNDRARDRRRGYLAALRSAGITPPDTWLIEVPITMDGGKTGIARLLEYDPPRAVFCGSDVIAAGAVFACLRQGIRVPDDMAIAGYDDLDIAAHLSPSLTTVRVPRFDIGVRAAEMIDAAIGGRPVAQLRVDMGFSIVWRESA